MGTLVLLSVNGDVLEAGGLSSFKTLNNKFFFNSLPVSLEYRWKNDGNDRVKPEGKVVIRNMFYIPAARISANAVSGNVLPHSTRLFNLEWIKHKDTSENPSEDNIHDSSKSSVVKSFFDRVSFQWKNFAVGLYFAKLDLTYGLQENHSSKTTLFFVFPWQLLTIIFIVLVVLFFLGKNLLKRYNRHIIEKARLGIKRSRSNDANYG
jgi:hypothetical protein